MYTDERVYYATSERDARQKAEKLIYKALKGGKHLSIEYLRRIEPTLWKLILTE